MFNEYVLRPLAQRVSGVSVSTPLTFVRTATKRAAGSKTSMKDSAGRRLGAKTGDGQLVRVGEIVYRQRGTKIYPGENMGIGRDHTLFAKEPGYVRFYYDPFHPKRKLVGVAMEKHARLPTPHFSPRKRRFGFDLIQEPENADRELTVMKRKEFLAQPTIQEELAKRDAKRQQKRAELLDQLKALGVEVLENEQTLALDRLLQVQLLVQAGGRSVAEAQKLADEMYYEDAKVALQFRNESELMDSWPSYQSLAGKLDSMVTFSPEAVLTKKYTAQELESMAAETIKKADEIASNLDLTVNDRKAQIKELVQQPCFELKQRTGLVKKYIAQMMQPLQPQSNLSLEQMQQLVKDKQGKIVKKWNYERRRVEQLFVPFKPTSAV